MKKSVFLETYPLCSLEISKSEIAVKSVDAIVAFFKEKIQNHKSATFIAIFDHFNHTKKLGGEIDPEIIDAKNVVFCFGPMIKNTKVLAIRPKSIGICELTDKFVIDFIEAPNPASQEFLESWISELKGLK
jgi:hypothetical protein